MRVAFLGLGTMGAAMANNVLRRRHELTVWNRTAARAEGFPRAADSPAAAVARAEVVISMLADPAAVDAVVAAALPALASGAVWVDMSTVDPECARRTDGAVRGRGGLYLDAPVSGSRKPAEEGTLLIMAAGPEAALEKARPVLEAMGRVRRVGDVGQGMAMKLVLNALGAHMISGFTSVLVLGRTLGLDPRDMLEVIAGGAFSSPLYAGKGARILQRDFAADFTLRLTLKDQDLVLETARAAGYPMPTLAAVRDVLDAACAAGLAEEDLCGLVRLFEGWAGVKVSGPPEGGPSTPNS